MTRKLLIAILVILLLEPVNAVTMSVINPSQYPLQSNSGVTLTISVYNEDLSEFKDLSVGLELSYPFQEISGETYKKRIGNLASKSSSYSTFRIKTYENVPEGEYPLRIYYCTGNCDAKTYNDVYLQFGGNSDIRLIEYYFNKEKIVPDEDFDVTLSIKNYGTGKLRDASLEINNSLQGTIPFIFKNKANNYFIGEIGAGSVTNVTFTITVNDDLASGVYSVPIIINTASQSVKAGDMVFNLNSKSDVVIPLVETEPLTLVLGKPITVIATLENIGPGDAKSVVAILEANSKKIGSTYLGKIESGDDDVALFDFIQGPEKDYVVRITYVDDLGEHELIEAFALDYEVVIDLSWLSNLIMLAVLCVAGYFIYKKKFAKNKKEK